MEELKTRNEVDKAFTWAIEDLFADEQAWQSALAKAEPLAEAMAAYKGKLNDAEQLLAYLDKDEELGMLLSDVCGYASLLADQDTADAHHQAMDEKAMGTAITVSQKLAFADVEIMAIEEADLKRFYEEQPKLLKYKRSLWNLRRGKEHILSEAEEKLLAAAQEIGAVPQITDNLLTNADIRFPSVTDSQGNTHALSNGSFIPLMQSPDRTLRKNAFKAYYAQYAAFKNTSASLLAGQLKMLKFNADARHFNSTLEAALHRTNVPMSVVHNLIDTIHENIHIMHKYVRLRKKMLGVDELHMYDLYTPLIPAFDVKVPFEEAKQNVLKAVSVLGEDYVSTIQKAFDERWIDIYENQGKRSGAYSSGQIVHPYVLLNHKDTIDSEFTLAHELGHAMHSYLSTRNQTFADRSYVIFVAEVASTCNEALLMSLLRKENNDKNMQAALINHFLEQFRGTIYRQTMFAEFELIINERMAKGEAINAAELNRIYHDLNVFYYGEDIVIDEEIDGEWARIPHFYLNYYVYQYATGFSAAIALAEKIQNEEGAVEKYLNFLKGGCSLPPIELLRNAGVDMESAQPIQDALKLFDTLIDEMEAILK